MEEDGVRYFIQYFQGEHKNEYTIRTTTGTVLLYANSVLKMRWHEGKDGKPFDQIVSYNRGKVDYFQDASCMIDNEKVKRIVNHKQGNRLEITSLKSGKLIYHGKFNELYQENDWGIQFDEASGKLVAEGIWENGKLTEITRCFDGDTMTELDRNGEDSLDPVKQIPIYVGGFYYDEDCETFYRNDEGCLIDGRTGIAYHEGLWNKGNEIHGRDLHDGWYTLPLNGDVLPNIIPVTEHTEVADSKSDNNNDNNKKENQSTSFVIYDMRELNWIEQIVTELFIASDCCNDAYSLKLSGFKNLKSLEIGDNSFSGFKNCWNFVRAKPYEAAVMEARSVVEDRRVYHAGAGEIADAPAVMHRSEQTTNPAEHSAKHSAFPVLSEQRHFQRELQKFLADIGEHIAEVFAGNNRACHAVLKF